MIFFSILCPWVKNKSILVDISLIWKCYKFHRNLGPFLCILFSLQPFIDMNHCCYYYYYCYWKHRCSCLQALDDSSSVSTILNDLLKSDDENQCLLAYQVSLPVFKNYLFLKWLRYLVVNSNDVSEFSNLSVASSSVFSSNATSLAVSSLEPSKVNIPNSNEVNNILLCLYDLAISRNLSVHSLQTSSILSNKKTWSKLASVSACLKAAKFAFAYSQTCR